MIGWTDRGRSYDYHNLIFDVPWPGMPRQKNLDSPLSPIVKKKFDDSAVDKIQKRPVFSLIKHYPPEWFTKLAISSD
jgi:hypothetical protein